MALMLWLVMLACAAVALFLTWRDAPRWLQMVFAAAYAAFAIWVVATQLDVVTLWWLIVTVALSLATSFWSDSRQRRKRTEAQQEAGR